MPRSEVLSPEGYRGDGRRANELRYIKARINLTTCKESSDGSSVYCSGLTTVMCTVSGPKEASSNMRQHVQTDRAFLNVNYTIAAFAGQERKKVSKTDKRIQELALSLQKTFSEAILLKLYPRSQIDINVVVLEQDGGAMAAAINATTLALVDAGIAMYNLVAATTAGIETSEAIARSILDLTYSEEIDTSFITLASDGSGDGEKINLLQCETKMSLDAFESCMALAIEGARQVKSELEDVCRRAGGEHRLRLSGQ